MRTERRYKIIRKTVAGMPYAEHKKLVEMGVKLYKDGMKTKDIAVICNVSVSTVQNWIRQSNVPFRDRRVYSYEMLDKMLDEYETTDIPLRELAEKYNIDYYSAKQQIYKMGGKRTIRAVPKNAIEVVQLDDDMNVVGIFSSYHIAERETGAKSNNICDCINHKNRKQRAGGYKWMKLKDYLQISSAE